LTIVDQNGARGYTSDHMDARPTGTSCF
jgi:hypothetical protein